MTVQRPTHAAQATPHVNPSDRDIAALLRDTHVIAMVGASSRPDRASHGIMRRLQRVGYRVIPVNPNETSVLGERAYPTLAEVPERIDLVNVFRRPDVTPAIAAEAVQVGARGLWLQLGVVNEEAARNARAGGLIVVMDACIAVLHAALQVRSKA